MDKASISQDEVLFQPVFEFQKGFYYAVAISSFFVALGIYAFYYQTRWGMGVTGLN